MPVVPKTELTEVLIAGLEDSGLSPVLLSSPGGNPRRLLLTSEGRSDMLWAYLWTLTPGGRPSLPNEYRIQMTGVSSPLAVNDGGPTVLLGYEPAVKMFAGFDVLLHRDFTPGSPSVQIDFRIVRQAVGDGLALDRKGNDEIACGVRPDVLGAYCQAAEDIHRFGKAQRAHDLLAAAAQRKPVSAGDMSGLSGRRRRIVREVASFSRWSSFRRVVLQAYENRCAVTGLQLKLIDAAHIVPVGAQGGSDSVRNGIALSPTYHRAYDRGLIFLDEQYCFRLNEQRAGELERLHLAGGMEQIVAPLDKRMIMPVNAEWRPALRYVRRANRLRRIAHR